MQTINSFFIRTIQPNRTTAIEIQRQTITVEPATVQFNDYPSSKISISKLIVKNQSKFQKKIFVTQTSKAYFEIKTKSRDIAPRQTSEIYIIFNPQRQKTRIEDEFCIKVDGQATVLHIPIICQYKSVTGSKLWSSKQIISNKENDEEKGSKTINVRAKRNLLNKNRHISIDHRHSNFIDVKRITISLFQEKFDKISRYVDDKKVKNEVYLGESQLELAAKREICDYSQKIQEINSKSIFNAISSRFTVEYHEEGPVIQIFNGVSLNWDANKNNSELIFRNGMSKMQEEVRKFIISLRFDKIKNYLAIYNDYRLKEENVGKNLRVEEYLQYLDAKLQNNKSLTDFEFQFDKNTMKHQEITIDYQRGPIDHLFRERNIRFEIVQIIGFDNWIPMNIVKQNYQEIYQLEEHQSPNYYIHMPTFIKDNRKGAHSELPFRSSLNPFKEDEDVCEILEFKALDFDESSVYELFKSDHKYYHTESDETAFICAETEKWLENYLLDL